MDLSKQRVKYGVGPIKGGKCPGIYFTDFDHAEYICNQLNRDAGRRAWRVYELSDDKSAIARVVNG